MGGQERDFVYLDRIWGRRLTQKEAIEKMPQPDPVAGWVPMSRWMLTREDLENFIDETDFKTFCISQNLNSTSLLATPYLLAQTLVYCMGCSKLCLNTHKFLIEHCNEPEHLAVLSQTHPDMERWPAAELGPSNRVPVSREFEVKAREREIRERPDEEELWMEREVAGVLGEYGMTKPDLRTMGNEEVGKSDLNERGSKGDSVPVNKRGDAGVHSESEGGTRELSIGEELDLIIAVVELTQLE
ncbi:hypothetical protein BDY19DRAFT_902612 [Irpex rosettiformis]|uniref:Uncharacterized protein n=1 Tax=Irpex rosettiformis TaxID=378272 RepID=A0ACB8UI28_9APHY|nr:hypothetical protein BDY19DRAFT_902612 [Irpex rosettiformis]